MTLASVTGPRLKPANDSDGLPTLPRRGPAADLTGRRGECDTLDRLIAAVRAGESRVLVVRGGKIRAIAFRAGANGLGEALLKREHALHLIVKLKRDTYGGSDRVEAEILDGAYV